MLGEDPTKKVNSGGIGPDNPELIAPGYTQDRDGNWYNVAGTSHPVNSQGSAAYGSGNIDTVGDGSASFAGGLNGSALGVVIGAALNFVGNYFSGKQQYKYQQNLMRLQSELNEAQAQRDYDRYMKAQRELMELQVELTSYSSQVKRAQKAGLNIGALFSSGGVSSPSTSSAGGVPSGSGVGLGSAPSGMFSGLSAIDAAQVRLINAQARTD